MTITGEALIGGVAVRGEGGAQRAFNPGTEQQFGEEFNAVSVEQVNDACRWPVQPSILSVPPAMRRVRNCWTRLPATSSTSARN